MEPYLCLTDLLDQELLNQWERFCRLSQERL